MIEVSAIQLEQEFNDYRLRVAACDSPPPDEARTIEEFRELIARWDQYHPAWMRNDRDLMRELEQALLL